MASEWPWVAGGALLLVVAVLWRGRSRRRTGVGLTVALRDGDPARRAAAVRVATEQGLRAYAAVLAKLIDVERDPRVLAALAEGVLRNSWEPADRPAILRLRLWAHEAQARGTSSTGEDPVMTPTAPLSVEAATTALRTTPVQDQGRLDAPNTAILTTASPTPQHDPHPGPPAPHPVASPAPQPGPPPGSPRHRRGLPQRQFVPAVQSRHPVRPLPPFAATRAARHRAAPVTFTEFVEGSS